MSFDEPLLGSVDESRGDVRLSIVVSADVQRVWTALTSGDDLPTWIGRLAGPPLGAGSQFDLWHENVVKSSHTIQLWNPPTLLKLTWDFPDEPRSQVTFHLEAQLEAMTLVRVEHRGLDDPISYAAGWHRHLTFLAAHLSGRDLTWESFWDDVDALADEYRAGPHRRPHRHPIAP